jgi:hypothetical protein
MFTQNKSRVKLIRQGDPSFMIKDGVALHPRAMLQITPDCPTNIKNHITWAYNNGYLKCAANVYDVDHLRDILAEE